MSTLPPGPRSAILQTVAFARDPFGTLRKCAERYGDPFTLPLVSGSLVLTGEPEVVREIFGAPRQAFVSDAVELLAPLAGEYSVLMLDGEAHRRERAILQPPFHGGHLKAYARLMQDTVLKHVAAWQPGQTVKMDAFTLAVSLDVIIAVVFGLRNPERAEVLARTIPEYFAAYTKPLIFFRFLRRNFGGIGPWRRFKAVATRLERLLFEEIEARRQPGGEGDDILSLLLAARYDDGSAMTDASVRDELKALLLAGHETSAISLAWAFYWLHREPEVMQRLQAELRGLGSHPNPEELLQLPYLSAVCDEALRLYPVVAMSTRRLDQPLTLRGYTLPAGVAVGASQALTHLDPTLYPDPLSFRPERFLERKYRPFEYMPFGGGARRCLGAAFALQEMKIVLGSVLAQKRFSLADNAPVTPAPHTFTIGPKGSVRMIYLGPAQGDAAA